MKATINEDGVLVVKAETPLECYALSQWWRFYSTSSYTSTSNALHPQSGLRVNFELPVVKPGSGFL